jgi:hypothetical protein
MAKSNPTRPDAPRDEVGVRDRGDLPDTNGPPLRDPRSVSAMDNIGVDDQAGLLDAELDETPGDRGFAGRSFTDDVRSDGNDDERHERR